MDRDTSRRSVLLWGGIGVHKLGVLLYSFALGQAGGAPALGTMATVLAAVWVVGTLAGLGLPDRVMFEAASRAGKDAVLPPEEGEYHGAYGVGILAVHVGVVIAAPMIAGVIDPDLSSLSRWMVLGAGLQSFSAYPFCARRGLGRPEVEAMSLLFAGGILALGYGLMDLDTLGPCWALACGIQAAGGAWVSWTTSGLRPRWPAQWRGVVRAGLPWLGFGVGAWLVGNMDVLTARWIASPEAVGQLQVGTMVVRAGGVLPWIVVTLSLHRMQACWARGEAVRSGPWVAWGVGLSTLIAGLAYGLMPFLARSHGLPVGTVTIPTLTAVACTPLMVVALMLLPVAAARDRGQVLRSIGLALVIGLMMLVTRPLGLGVSDCIVAAAAAQFVVIVRLAVQLMRP